MGTSPYGLGEKIPQKYGSVTGPLKKVILSPSEVLTFYPPSYILPLRVYEYHREATLERLRVFLKDLCRLGAAFLVLMEARDR